MRVAIHQPNLFPRLKVAQKIASADLWVILDHVQFCQREWQNRARIVPMHSNPEPFWLTVPVHLPHGRETKINEALIANPKENSLLFFNTLKHSFAHSPYWPQVQEMLSIIQPFLSGNSLTTLCQKTTEAMLAIAGIKVPYCLSSSLGLSMAKSELMSAICRKVNASCYLADSGSLHYLDLTCFKGMSVLLQTWTTPPERGVGNVSWRDISAINYLARYGANALRDHLLHGSFIEYPVTHLGIQTTPEPT